MEGPGGFEALVGGCIRTGCRDVLGLFLRCFSKSLSLQFTFEALPCAASMQELLLKLM